MTPHRRWLVMAVCLVASLAGAREAAAVPVTCTWTGGGITNHWSDAGNWDNCGGVRPVPQGGEDLVFPNSTTKRSSVNDLVGLVVGKIRIEADTALEQHVITGNSIGLTLELVFTGTTAGTAPAFLVPIVCGGTPEIVNAGPGPAAARLGALDLDFAATDVITTGAPIHITGTVSGWTGTLRKLGNFGLILSGANTYQGTTTIEAGNVELRTSTALGLSNVTEMRGGASVTLGPGVAIGEVFDAQNATSGPPATLRLPTGDATLAGRLEGTLLDYVLDVGTGATLQIVGAFKLPNRWINKEGGGTAILGNANNEFDGANVNGGVLGVGASGAYPDGATLRTLPGAVFALNGVSDTIGSILDSSGTIAIGAGTLTINQTAFGAINGGITGTGQFVKAGTQMLLISNSTPIAFTGGTTVVDGDLNLAKPEGITAIRGPLVVNGGRLLWGESHLVDDSVAVTVNAPGVLMLGWLEAVASLSGTGSVQLSIGGLTVGGTHASMLFAGTFTGAGSLRKVGSGTLTLTGVHPFTGSTNVAGGALLVNGSLGGTLSLSGGLVGGTGSVGSITPTAFGGVVSPGASVGMFGAANMSLGAGSIFAVELNGTTPGTGYDRLTTAGNVTLFGSMLSATLGTGFAPPAGATFTIIDIAGAGAALGTFAGLPQNANLMIGGRPFRISYAGGDGNDVVLTALAIPEISITDVTVIEGDAGSTNATFTVSLSSAAVDSVSVQYATVNASAASPQDYASQGGTLVFLPGSQTQTVTVAVYGDTVVEPAETFVVRLSNAHGGATIADADGVGTIGNDDTSPTEPPPPPPPTALTWYLAEGATGAFFDNDLLIANPTTTAAPVTLTFFKEDGSTVVDQRTIAAQSRATIHVDQLAGLENASAAVRVTSTDGVPLVVERTMFWDATYYGGHTGAAVSQAAPTWYFAEAAQGFFDTFVLVTNANTAAADVTLTFLREGEPPVVKTVPVGASSRVTIAASAFSELIGRSFGLIVEATQPVIAERAMYFGTTSTQLWSGGHESPGVTQTSTSWFHAEGATGGFFDTFILLSNPQDDEAHVTLDFLTESGATVRVTRTVPGKGRVTVDIEAQDDPRLRAGAVSTVVTADRPIVSERSTYWAGDALPWGEGHNSFGLTETAVTWGLAEGRVGGAHHFTTFILLANPQTSAAEVKVMYLRESGAPIVKTYTLLPESRFTIGVNSDVPELHDEAFGARIEVTNAVPIAVERSMYWDANGIFWAGGSHAPGTRLP